MVKIWFLLLVLFLPLVLAQEASIYLKTDFPGVIEFPCYNSTNGKCDSNTTCNITISSPDGENIVNNEPTIFIDGLFTYNITPTEVGDYSVFLYCYSNAFTGYNNFIMQSNNHGKKLENFNGIMALSAGVLLALIILLVFLILRRSVWMYPTIIGISVSLTVFFYVWWSYSLILTGLLFIFYQISTWLMYVTIILCGYELIVTYFNWISRKKRAQNEYGDNF